MENSGSVSLKLLIDTKRQKVLFAEASKDFVDFLFTLLSLPVGTVSRLLSKDGMVGCMGKLYESVENLNQTYMQLNLNKDILLKPKAPIAGPNILRLSENDVESNAKKVVYLCSGGRCSHNSSWSDDEDDNCEGSYYSDDPKTKCPSCDYAMDSKRTYVAPRRTTTKTETSGAGEGGYVKGFVTYMVMDDLEVKPMSTISSITMLNRFNVKDVGALEEKVVSLGMDEGLKLLKVSLESESVLTNVYLGKKAASHRLI